MDTLQVEVRFEQLPDEPCPALYLVVAINGAVVEGYSVDILALKKSAETAGEHYIWTCECGAPQCAGLYYGVGVSYTPALVVWQVPRKPLPAPTRFEFDRPAYVATIHAALAEYISYYRGYKAARMPFNAAHDWQLAGILPPELR